MRQISERDWSRIYQIMKREVLEEWRENNSFPRLENWKEEIIVDAESEIVCLIRAHLERSTSIELDLCPHRQLGAGDFLSYSVFLAGRLKTYYMRSIIVAHFVRRGESFRAFSGTFYGIIE